MDDRCPRLDELEAGFGWSRGGSSFLVETTIDGRSVGFVCRQDGRIEPHWGIGVPWSQGIPRRKRKRAAKQVDELIALALDPAGRRVLESVSRASPAAVGDGFRVFPAVLDYRVEGEPPPAEKVLEVAEVLVAVATRIESLLDDAV
jgi:hypothetical protein